MTTTVLTRLTEMSPNIPSNPTEIKDSLVRLLKSEVEETFGRRIISSRDCIHLSEEVYFKSGYRINHNTLRRFYGLVKADYPPSTSTLTIISKYCGFNSLEEVINNYLLIINNKI